MQRVIWQNELRPLRGSEPIFHQRHVQVLVTTIELVAHDRMTDVCKVNAYLVLPAGMGNNAKHGKLPRYRADDWPLRLGTLLNFLFRFRFLGFQPLLDPVLRQRRYPIGADTVFDRDRAPFVFSERGVNETVRIRHVSVDQSDVLLLNFPLLPQASQSSGRLGVFCDDGDAAGLTVQTIHQLRM